MKRFPLLAYAVFWLALLGLLILAAYQMAAQSFTRTAAFKGAAVQRASAEAGNTLTNGIIAYWAMESGVDWTNRANEATYELTEELTVTAVTGYIGNGANFDGAANNNLYYADADVFSPSEGSMTVAFWCKPGKTNATEYWVTKDSLTAGTREWAIANASASGRFIVNYYTNASTSSPVSIGQNTTIGAWHFVVATFDASAQKHAIRMGITNALNPWYTFSGTWGSTTNTTQRLRIGQASTVELLGVIDEVGIWSRVLTDSEITNLWNNGTGRTWPLE
jgi:hypothetical protein